MCIRDRPRDAWYDAVELECSAGAITGEELACGNLEVDVQAGSVQLLSLIHI